MNPRIPLTLVSLALFPTGAALACASCGCSVNTDWTAQGISSASGWSADLRFDYLNQNQLRSGTGKISAADAAGVTNTQTNDFAEIEQYTKNHYFTATADYSDGNSWGMSFTLPVITRSHATLGVGGDGSTPGDGAYTSSGSGLGDIKLVGRYFGFSEQRNMGLQLGLKLPTGKKNQVANSDTTIPVDPGLQRGTGTTDLIVGAYQFGDLAPSVGYFSQITYQAAVSKSTMAAGSYKPGDSLSLSVGARYTGLASFTPTAQLNLRHAKSDSGEAGDAYATGGTLVYLTLGGILPVNDKIAPYANVQLPVYQKVNGIQLAPKAIFSVGAKLAF